MGVDLAQKHKSTVSVRLELLSLSLHGDICTNLEALIQFYNHWCVQHHQQWTAHLLKSYQLYYLTNHANTGSIRKKSKKQLHIKTVQIRKVQIGAIQHK